MAPFQNHFPNWVGDTLPTPHFPASLSLRLLDLAVDSKPSPLGVSGYATFTAISMSRHC